MNDFAATLTRWTVRIALMLIGLVFFVSLLTVAALLALLWGAFRAAQLAKSALPRCSWRYAALFVVSGLMILRLGRYPELPPAGSAATRNL